MTNTADSNAARADVAEQSLAAYYRIKNDAPRALDPACDGLETLVGLLADLLHWAARANVDFAEAVRTARVSFKIALAEQARKPAGERSRS